MSVAPTRFLRALLVTLALCALPAGARAVPPGWAVTPVHTGLGFPVGLRFVPDGRLFYIERGGRIMVFDSDTDPAPQVWATLPVNTVQDRGLLGIAIHPAWPDSPFVYFFHSNPSPLVDRVVRFRDHGGLGVDLVVLRDDIPSDANPHHGGRLAFDLDGDLWLTYGDQGSSATAQDPGDIRGKLLRFTSMGEDAPGNPFGGGTGAAMGVRNAFGLCFDPLTGRGYFTDNGPTCDDELNLIAAGANYGWGPSDPCNGQPGGTTMPLASFTPPFAPTGCAVVRGSSHPALEGNLFFGGYVDASLHRVYFTPGSDGTAIDSVVVFHQMPGNPVLDVTVGNEGKLWFATHNAVHRIDPPAPVAVATPERAARTLRASPNPFVASVALRLDGPAGDARIEIYDAGGRLVRRWSGTGAITWDGRDEAGRGVPPGIYSIRARGDGWEAAARLARLGGR